LYEKPHLPITVEYLIDTLKLLSGDKVLNSTQAAGYEEASLPCYADYAFRTDMGRVEIVRAMFTEYATEMVLLEQHLRRSTGFIIGIMVEDSSKGYRYLASCPGIFGKFIREE
jgi:hypothetical protein